jgi:hypothetical protein
VRSRGTVKRDQSGEVKEAGQDKRFWEEHKGHGGIFIVLKNIS